MKDFITLVIRHSERIDFIDKNQWKNCARYRINKYDSPISKHGIEIAQDKALELQQKYSNLKNAIIISSPFTRCIETSIVLSMMFDDMKIHIEPGLRESFYGVIDYMDNTMTNENIFNRYRSYINNFNTEYKPIYNYEEMKQTSINPKTELTRPIDTIKKIRNMATKNKPIIIITHGLNLVLLVKKMYGNIETLRMRKKICGKDPCSFCATIEI